MCPDAAKGVDARECSDSRVILDSNVPAQRGGNRIGSSDFKAEPGRYHLYLAHSCPWAHRVLIFLVLKKLEHAISTAFAIPGRRDEGWTFDDHVGIESAAAPDLNSAPDATIRPNENVGSHPGFWTDDGRGMDHGK